MADEGIKRLIELGVNASPAIAELQKLNKATQEQTASLDGLQGGLAKMVETATTVFQALAVVDLAKQFIENVRGMIEQMDQLGKSAQATGVSVQKLQELQFAFKLGAGLDEGQASAALTRFSDKLAEVGTKTTDAARVLKELKITSSDTADSGLAKLADAFEKAPDGVNKTAIATELFGRTLGEKMIPLLNQGSKGLADAREELHLLGGTFSDEATKQASEFDDNLTKLTQHGKEFGVMITSALLPSLVELSGKFVQAAKDGNVLSTALGRYWENVQDFWTKTGRAIGVSNAQTNQETREAQGRLDDYAKTMAGYAQQVDKMKTAVDLPPAHIEKIKAAAKAAAQAKSDFENWMDSMLKIAQGDKDLEAKIDWLTRGLAGLAAAGDTSSETWKKWNAELLKLRPDAVASELLKLADAAKKLDEATSDKMLKGLEGQLAALEAAGPAAGSAVKLLHDQILKIRADGGDAVAAVTIELEKMRIATQKNVEEETIWFELLAQGKITAQEFSDGLSKHLAAAHDGLKGLKGDTFDLAKALSDASAQFVTTFVNNLIDGFGAVHKSFSQTIADMLKQLAKLITQQEIAAGFKSVQASGGWGSLLGLTAAQGAAWSGPGVQAMASGGILTSPTFFASGGRMAVAGEAGPEAVVPLQRGPSGNLGVAASPVTVNVVNHADANVTTASRDNTDGSRQIDIYIEQKVKKMMNDGSMDKTMRSTYGVSRQPAMG